jgi:hypothetical protein
MEEILLELMEALEVVGREHEELYDTDVRDQMFSAVFSGFVEHKPDFELPLDYGLYDQSANEAVAAALAHYIERANTRAEQLGLKTKEGRLAAFQNEEVHTAGEQAYPDDFFGWMDPDDLS